MIIFVCQDTHVSRTGLAHQKSDAYGSSVLHTWITSTKRNYLLFYNWLLQCTHTDIGLVFVLFLCAQLHDFSWLTLNVLLVTLMKTQALSKTMLFCLKTNEG